MTAPTAATTAAGQGGQQARTATGSADRPGQPRPAAEGNPAAQVAGPQGHLCLGCGCRIAPGLLEIQVRSRRRTGIRYRHASDDDCAAAIRAPQPNNSLIGRYQALPTFEWQAAPDAGGQADRDDGTAHAGDHASAQQDGHDQDDIPQ
jgi:hypothetical protein